MFCTDIPSPLFLIFSSYTPQLLYYSHLPTALVALLLGAFVYYKNRQILASKLLLGIALTFSLWSFFDLILWTNIDSRRIMFFWSFINFLEVMVSATTLYFVFVFIEKRDISLKLKTIMGVFLLTFLVLIPTKLNLSGFDLVNCEAQQGKLIYYFYFLESLFLLWMIVYLIRKIVIADGERRKEIIYFSIGATLFLASFSGANLTGSILALTNPENPDNWKILQYGLFGMPVFMAFLVYLIVKYKAFNIRLMAVQALVIALIILIGSQFFFIRNFTNRVLTGITLITVTGFGWLLIRSVALEIKRKEELQDMSNRLSRANDNLRKLDNTKSEFISIASHQLRTPLTAIKGYTSLLLEGSYGRLTDKIKGTLNKIYISNERLIDLVEDLLNLSRIEAGRMEYKYEKFRMEDLCKEIYDTFIIRAKEKKLELNFKYSDKLLPEVTNDRKKLREVLSNLVDNAIKYTPEGRVELALSQNGGNIWVSVSDTGVGISSEELTHLFEKFTRGKEGIKVDTNGTGLGLHVGRRMMEALHGRIWAESEGVGKGSTFFVEVPIIAAEEGVRVE